MTRLWVRVPTLSVAKMLRSLGLTSSSVAARRAFASTSLCFAPKTGKVVSWMQGRGYGFIEDHAEKKQHFVHFSVLKTEAGGFRALSVGQEVEFDVTEADGRPRAENVTAPGGNPLPSGERPPQDGRGDGRSRGRGRGSDGGRDNRNQNRGRLGGDRPDDRGHRMDDF